MNIITGNPYFANLFEITISPNISTLFVKKSEAQNSLGKPYIQKELSLVSTNGFRAITPDQKELRTVISDLIKNHFQAKGFIYPSEYTKFFSPNYIQSKPVHQAIDYRLFDLDGTLYLNFDIGILKCNADCCCHNNKTSLALMKRLSDIDIKQLSYLDYGGTKDRLTKIQKIAQDIAGFFPIQIGAFTIAINPSLLNLQNAQIVSTGDEPYLLFDQTDDSKTSPVIIGGSSDGLTGGLSEWGPYEKPINNHIKVILLAPANKINLLRSFVQALQTGSRSFSGGMPHFFGSSVDILREVVAEMDVYEDALRKDFQNTEKSDIVLVYTPEVLENHEEDEVSFYDSNYFKVKAYCASEGIPTQMIDEVTLSNPQWKDLNFALSVFSKTGHVPWVLANNEALEGVDLFLGLSYSNLKDDSKKVVGYVNVFDNFGRWQYFIGDTKIFDFRERNKNFGDLIKETIARYITQTKRSPQTICIHYSKRFSREEREIIGSAIKNEIENPRIIFVSITSDHPLRVFDADTPDKSFKRGFIFKVTNQDFYLSTTGYNILDRTVRTRGVYGTPKLLHIRIWTDPEALSATPEQIAYQILSLSKLNWASSKPYGREPITIKYAGNIAYLMRCFQMTQWKNINANLRDKPWFI